MLLVRLRYDVAGRGWLYIRTAPPDPDRDRVTMTVTTRPRVRDAEGLTLVEFHALMDRASLFVGGDSGPLHVAATSNVPCLRQISAGAVPTRALESPEARA